MSWDVIPMVWSQKNTLGTGVMNSFKERRRTPRYKTLKGALLRLSASHEETQAGGVLLDLSKDGCCIASEMLLTVSQYYRLVLVAFTGCPVTIETAVVCWRSKSTYGLKFITVGMDQEELLEQNLLQLRSPS